MAVIGRPTQPRIGLIFEARIVVVFEFDPENEVQRIGQSYLVLDERAECLIATRVGRERNEL
ncbi:hypothetical protein D3C83_121610 [compost metagenome]